MERGHAMPVQVSGGYHRVLADCVGQCSTCPQLLDRITSMRALRLLLLTLRYAPSVGRKHIIQHACDRFVQLQASLMAEGSHGEETQQYAFK